MVLNSGNSGHLNNKGGDSSILKSYKYKFAGVGGNGGNGAV
jgi:hypothetical protein